MTSNLKFLHISDFSGGLNTYNPASELKITESPDEDNITLSEKGFHKRLGDSKLNTTAMNSGANVQGLTYFSPTGGGDYLVAVAGSKIFQNASYASTMTDITSSLTVTAGQNYIWTFAKLNGLCIGVGGNRDTPFKWNGTGNAAVLGGTPPAGSFCFEMKDRVFIGSTSANPSTIYWSILANPEDWSGAGSGNNAAVTNDGDYLVGGTPLNNNIALLFKNYSIHQMCVDQTPFPIKPIMIGYGACGKNAIVRGPDGLVYFITNEPRMRATDGYSLIDFPNSINDIWDGISKSRLSSIYGVYVPVQNEIHWYVSSGTSSTNDICLIWDLYRKCWIRHTAGFKCNVAAVGSGNRLFGGHYNGFIYEKYKASTYNDASETSPGAINAYWRTPWINNNNNMSVKHPRYMDINYKTQTSGTIQYSFGFNYNADQKSGYISQVGAGGKWDIDAWDTTFVWGGATNAQKRIWSYGRGNNVQIKVGNNTPGETISINGFDLALQEQGIKEIVSQ